MPTTVQETADALLALMTEGVPFVTAYRDRMGLSRAAGVYAREAWCFTVFHAAKECFVRKVNAHSDVLQNLAEHTRKFGGD